jgi:uncharacterized protein YvpB
MIKRGTDMEAGKRRGRFRRVRFGGAAVAACALVVLIVVAAHMYGMSVLNEPQAAACECGAAKPVSSLPYVEEFGLPAEDWADDDELVGLAAADYCAAVPEMVQYPEMPAGCEVYSLAAVLRALGYDADPHEIVMNHLPFISLGGSDASAYSGNPYVEGEGLPPAIVRAGNSFLEEAGSDVRFVDVTGSSFEELEALADGGTPVLVWTTMYLEDPGFDSPVTPYTFYPNEHCLVLLGTEGDVVLTMDPMVGYASYDREWFQYLYEQCGSMAVTLAV